MAQRSETLKKGLVLVAGLAAVMFYAALFSPFLPGRHALLGHDYGLKLPQLLDGYFWFKNKYK